MFVLWQACIVEPACCVLQGMCGAKHACSARTACGKACSSCCRVKAQELTRDFECVNYVCLAAEQLRGGAYVSPHVLLTEEREAEEGAVWVQRGRHMCGALLGLVQPAQRKVT